MAGGPVPVADGSTRGRLRRVARVAPPPRPDPGRPLPLVSVVVPCYNYARYLPVSVGSALAQEGVRVEVIVVDDASPDDSFEVATGLAAADGRVRVLRHEHNAGPVGTYNDGFAVATGDYIVRLDADDLLTPGSLARSVALLERFPSVGLVYGHPVHFAGAVPTDVRTEPTSWSVWAGRDWLAERCRTGFANITSPEVVLRGTVARRVGGQDPELAQTHDVEMWLRVSAVADVGRVDGCDQALHRDHPQSRSALQVDQLTDLRERRLAYDTVFRGAGAGVAGAELLHRVAMRTLAVQALASACHAYDRGRAGTEPVQEWVALARELYPEVERLPQWRALRRRQRVGARLAPYVPNFVAAAALRRVQDGIRYRRWTATGL